ncbi:MAG: ATP-binding cassette domain-containing protein, partial [Actinomycetia bacterium]|nr:ATP-binding cassette domain-containing protein [Actinomycetes bacterium]
MEAVTAPLITLRDLAVRYGTHLALVGVDLTLERGSTTALVGSNGSGKTTLLRILGGL